MIAICGTQQASIAWPDRPAERFIVDDMARNGVEEIIPIENIAVWRSDLTEADLVKIKEELQKRSSETVLLQAGLTVENLRDELNKMEELGIKPADLEGLTIATDGTVTPAPGTDIVPDGEGGAVVVASAGDDLEAGQMVSVTDGVALPIDAPGDDQGTETAPPPITEAQAIRNYLNDHGTGTPNKVVIAALKEAGYKIESTQVSAAKKEIAASAQSISS